MTISVPVERSTACFAPDPSRVITKPFGPGGDLSDEGRGRLDRILARVLALSEAQVAETLNVTRKRFEHRHRDLRSVFETHFAAVAGRVAGAGDLSPERRLLIGAYFTHEYSIEAAALSNPSIVRAPYQGGLTPGQTRFVLSLRAIGEGHISSIEFRSGVIDADGEVRIDLPSRYAATARREAPLYEKATFHGKLLELRAYNEIAASVLDALQDRFTLHELESVIDRIDREHQPQPDSENVTQATRTLHWLASSNYESFFPAGSELSERVLFPAGATESNGMEDARFVRFTHDDGTITYFATYTAFDRYQVLPQLIETADFLKFSIATLNGAAARNKGIALFPRKIQGQFFALARQDNENNFLMWSDNVRFWHGNRMLQAPVCPWELIQLGNCGSPLETEAGWLVITHGVGAMRQYALGAILLDREDPNRVIGHLDAPLLEPTDDERDGYVPNVVYSCGSMIAGRHLVLPYGFSDIGTRIATVRVDDLLTELTRRR
jgi:predicted GH43/DUF377 family glycosyl hydrolase